MDELLAVVGDNSGDNEFRTYFIRKEGKPIPLQYPFRSSSFTILLVTEGRAHVQVNLINYVLHPDEMLVIAPDAVRQFKNLSFDCSVSAVGFSRDFLMHAGIHQNNVDAIELLALQNEPFVKIAPPTTSNIDGLLHVLDAKRRESPASIYSEEIIRHSFAAVIYKQQKLSKTTKRLK